MSIKRLAFLTLLPFTFTLSGCAALTGLSNARDDFACNPEMNPYCGSVTSVHQGIDREGDKPVRMVTTEGEPVDTLAIDSPLVTPKRAPEMILRIWIAPFIDREGDLHDQHLLFVTVRDARWAPETLQFDVEESDRHLKPLEVKPRSREKTKKDTTP